MQRGIAAARTDSDRSPDRVAVVARYGSAAGCRFFLYVERTAVGDVVRTIVEDNPDDSEPSADVPWPRLYGTADVNGDRRSEALVIVAGMAISRFEIFGAQKASLEKFTLGGRRVARFGNGGHNYSAAAVDCLPGQPGRLVSASADRTRRDWRVSRTTFRVVAMQFRYVASRRLRVRSLDELREFSAARNTRRAPFSSCAAFHRAKHIR
ncbi:MAG: hypothetical protein M3321_01320 [Actinomycetota bacterium]|nr:hypothetical protein [Actinomycetota bacterium]